MQFRTIPDILISQPGLVQDLAVEEHFLYIDILLAPVLGRYLDALAVVQAQGCSRNGRGAEIVDVARRCNDGLSLTLGAFYNPHQVSVHWRQNHLLLFLQLLHVVGYWGIGFSSCCHNGPRLFQLM